MINLRSICLSQKINKDFKLLCFLDSGSRMAASYFIYLSSKECESETINAKINNFALK